MEETVKKRYFGLCIAINSLSNNIAAFLGQFSAVILPSDTDPEALADSQLVRLVIGFQAIIAIIGLMMFLFYIRYDSVKWYLSQDDRENAMKTINFYFVDVDTEGICN